MSIRIDPLREEELLRALQAARAEIARLTAALEALRVSHDAKHAMWEAAIQKRDENGEMYRATSELLDTVTARAERAEAAVRTLRAALKTAAAFVPASTTGYVRDVDYALAVTAEAAGEASREKEVVGWEMPNPKIGGVVALVLLCLLAAPAHAQWRYVSWTVPDTVGGQSLAVAYQLRMMDPVGYVITKPIRATPNALDTNLVPGPPGTPQGGWVWVPQDGKPYRFTLVTFGSGGLESAPSNDVVMAQGQNLRPDTLYLCISRARGWIGGQSYRDSLAPSYYDVGFARAPGDSAWKLPSAPVNWAQRLAGLTTYPVVCQEYIQRAIQQWPLDSLGWKVP